MTVRINEIMSGLNVYEVNMKANLYRFGGVVFSQQVLLKLVEKGLRREDAYKIVQELTKKAWNKIDGDFKKQVHDSKEVSEKLSKDEIEECFNPEYHLKNIDYIFEALSS